MKDWSPTKLTPVETSTPVPTRRKLWIEEWSWTTSVYVPAGISPNSLPLGFFREMTNALPAPTSPSSVPSSACADRRKSASGANATAASASQGRRLTVG